MKIKAKDFIAILQQEFEDEDEIILTIGSGRKEYPVADLQKGIIGNKLVFATEGFANWKRSKKELF